MPARIVARAVKKPSARQPTPTKRDRLLPTPKRDPEPPKQHMIGYARVSMSDQNNQRQIDDLTRFGVDPSDIYTDKASGRTMKRPGWIACWKDLREGDVLVVHAIDRLGRDIVEVVKTIRALHDKGADLKVLSMDIDTRTPTGRLLFGILASLAQWERELIVERTQHGLAAARARGRIGGAEKKISNKLIAEARRRIDKGERGEDVAREYGVSRQTLYKRFAEMRQKK